MAMSYSMNSARAALGADEVPDREVTGPAERAGERLAHRLLEEGPDRVAPVSLAGQVAGRPGQVRVLAQEFPQLLVAGFELGSQDRVVPRPRLAGQGVHHPGEDVAGRGGEEHVLRRVGQVLAEDRGGDLEDLIAALGRILLQQVGEQVPDHPAGLGLRPGRDDGITRPVELLEEVALGVEDHEDVVLAGPVPQVAQHVHHRVGLAGADAPDEQDVLAEVGVVEAERS